MLINGIESSSLGVYLYDRVLNSNRVETSEEWLDGDIQPTVIRQQDKFKDITLSFLVLGQNEEEAFMRISQLTKNLKKAQIQFDDLNLIFNVSMTGQAQPTRLKNGNFIVEYNLTSDYAQGDREIYTTNANLTNSFKLTILYYQNSTQLIASETMTLYASAFDEDSSKNSLESLGIQVDKYLPQYYNHGIATNLGGLDISYDNFVRLQTLIINYTPISYNLNVHYFMNDGTGYYQSIVEETITFTYPKLQNISTIGQLINIKKYQPDGYSSRVDYQGELTVEGLLQASPINVFYNKIENELSKNVTLQFRKENDAGEYDLIDAHLVLVRESDFYDGLMLQDLIDVNSFRPEKYYNAGYIENHSLTEFITYETTETSYIIKYPKSVNTVYVEYYAGVYPDWYRLSTVSVSTKYMDSYAQDFSLDKIDIDLDKYQTSEYLPGKIYNANTFDTYDSVINAGVIQVYYEPINYPLTIKYYKDGIDEVYKEETIQINATQFFSNPILSDIININQNRPDGYQFAPDLSYNGEVTLSALTAASPITIVYEVIEASRTKNVLVKYKQELASAYSTITTILITVNESDWVGGLRLKDVINLNAYLPDYYESGVLDGASSTALITFDQIESNYDVVYMAAYYTTPVRYYIDEISDLKWIGSDSLEYRVIDFTTDTTLYDLGLDVNAYKPSYASNGEIQYTGPINFTALRELTSINVLYTTLEEPDNPDDIDYPHRFLFLQHNDLGDYENLHPEWTMNHAYINTGVSVDDMSKLTVVMECARVDQNVPLHNVNEGYAYLFGSESIQGSFFMRFNNQTQYGTNLTGVNTYEAKAGYYTDTLVLTEESAIGFSENTGIYASDRQGYSYATFTYTHNLPTENVPMVYPLYLFANNKYGSYSDGLAGIGIYGCRIYYNNQLIRDMIPVQYYDKIGSQVAPSNCLYDKISQTFFEDATGQDSFNIIDDDRYPDTNPEHQIGHCYVKYYQDDQLFKTVVVYFRASDFINQEYDAYEAFNVDGLQPAYTNIGYIENFDNLVFDFDNMNNATYNVIYETLDTQIVVNYYREDSEGIRTLIQTDTLPITEKDFYQAPTFGDIVRLNKYKPDGYKTDFKYEGSKVSLNRVLALSPYTIVYVPETEPLQEYKTTVKYIKKVFGIRQYENVGSVELTFDQTDFRDGEYIDFYIDKNLYKPEKYYLDGITYEWYEMDERLNDPLDLKAEYIIMYPTSEETIDINYYVDEVSDEALIASTSWSIKLDDFNGEFQLPDQLPNDFINKYKPVTCSGGLLQNPSAWYTFESLVELGEISIVYPRVDEPNDPENAMYEQKVLYWGRLDDYMAIGYEAGSAPMENGAVIPYIDIGYRPKEIGRLRVEITGDAQVYGCKSGTTPYGLQTLDYTYWFGYWGPTSLEYIGTLGAESLGKLKAHQDAGGETVELLTDISPGSKGCFGIGAYIPTAENFVYTAQGPQSLDGAGWHSPTNSAGQFRAPEKRIHGIDGYYRKGFYSYADDNYEEHIGYNNYGISQKVGKNLNVDDLGTDGYIQLKLDVLNDGYYKGEPPMGYVKGQNPCFSSFMTTGKTYCFANPFTIIMDAYNGYMSVFDNAHSNSPKTMIIDDSKDVDIFENREQPKGSLTLFRTTNPTTGKVNILPLAPKTWCRVHDFPWQLSHTAIKNPYIYGNTDEYGQVEDTVLTITGQDEFGNPIYSEKTSYRIINYADWKVPVAPQIGGAAVWRVKVYDQDRLVRDMIPVAKGDKIYDYTMPDDGLFDLVTEIFFGNANQGGHYEGTTYNTDGPSDYSIDVHPPSPDDWRVYGSGGPEYYVLPMWAVPDLISYGKITTNYYDWDNSFIDNQFVNVPTWFYRYNTTIEDLLSFNDFKPNDFYLDGFLDLDADITFQSLRLEDIYNMGSVNVFYKLRTYTKTVVYYRGNIRVGSKDVFYNEEDIKNAQTLSDLGIDVNLYQDENFKPGRVVFNEQIIAEDDVKAFIDAPSPIVVYDKYTKEEKPNLLYLEYYRGGAYDDNLITIDPNDPNYLNCNLTAKVINPYGAIKYYNHYHTALYEDEKFDYFIPYQVRVLNHYTGIHYGPARRYKTLAMIVRQDVLTIVEERNGWGRLREYPTGWILLSATEPMTGPGQNPDYDAPDDQVATIPFAEEIEISRLTIDRLWCYIPAEESWVKAEDVSYDQAGKLYNGLKIEVIDLDTIDFNSVTSLADMGIYPERYRMRFHDYCGYTYDGEYTKEAFSNIHSIDFVYPETIYNYTCIYYKDNKADENELGRAGFTCTISDWNPDWDVFIETSWKYDEEDNPINPTLYRDTEITLTWDYFGFERNLFKPEGYPDGLYLWNPRSWQNQDIYFSFQELIATGSQYVVYPSFEPNLYKMCIPLKATRPFSKHNGYRFNSENDGIPIKKLQIWTDEYSKHGITAENDLLYDIEYAQEYISRKDLSSNYGYDYNQYANGLMCTYNASGNLEFAGGIYFGGYNDRDKDPTMEIKPYISSSTSKGIKATTDALIPDVGDGIIFNFSNSRQNNTNIVGFYNDILGKEETFYLDGYNNTLIPIEYNTNLHVNMEYPKNSQISKDAGMPQYEIDGIWEWYSGNNREIACDLNTYWRLGNGIHKYIKFYKNYLLVNYFVPVPKGLHYIWNGEKLQIPKDGMFDLMNGKMVGSNMGRVASIYRREQDPNTEEPFYYFEGLTFDSDDCSYIVQINTAGTAYDYPDVLSLEESDLTEGLVLPVSKVTSDTAHNIIGEWYYSSGRWFQSNLASMYAGNFDSLKLSEDYKTIVLVNNKDTSMTFYTYLNPEGTTPGSSSEQSYGKNDVVLTSYYTYTNSDGHKFYFDGIYWIPESYTQFNKTDINKTYAVMRDTPYYSLPYISDEYKAGILLYGERTSILYVAANNPNWGYTGRGWVQIENNLDPVL